MKKRFFLLFVFALVGASLAFAQNYDDVDEEVVEAYQKYKKGKRLKATDEYYLAEVYLYGYFGERFNPQKYLSLVNSAANRGDEDAQYDVEEGIPFAQIAGEYLLSDLVDPARYWGLKAIEIKGDFSHTEFLGLICANRALNFRIGRNYKLAYEYARLGGELGNANATAELALCYGNGYGVLKDVDKAYALMKTARQMHPRGYGLSDPKGEYERAYSTFARQTSSNRLSSIQRAQNNAENNLKRSASASSSQSMRMFIATACVVAGVVAICEAFAPKSSSHSSDSYYTSLSASNSISICPDCTGRGMENCVWCSGSGIIKGGFFSNDHECSYCNGKGQVWCWHCNGRGSR